MAKARDLHQWVVRGPSLILGGLQPNMANLQPPGTRHLWEAPRARRLSQRQRVLTHHTCPQQVEVRVHLHMAVIQTPLPTASQCWHDQAGTTSASLAWTGQLPLPITSSSLDTPSSPSELGLG